MRQNLEPLFRAHPGKRFTNTYELASVKPIDTQPAKQKNSDKNDGSREPEKMCDDLAAKDSRCRRGYR